MMHGTDVMLHAITRVLNAQFSLSLYCSRRLYSVTSRGGSNDQWLSQSLKQAGQMLIVPSTTHVSVVLPFEGKSSAAPLTVFLACILYFVICFRVVFDCQPTCSAWPKVSPPRHRIHCAARHTSQMTCHFQNSCDLFHFISKCVKIVSS